jgi:nucleotide-binding universal stress UspA family protein
MEDVLFGSASSEVRHGVDIPVLLLRTEKKEGQRGDGDF